MFKEVRTVYHGEWWEGLLFLNSFALTSLYHKFLMIQCPLDNSKYKATGCIFFSTETAQAGISLHIV